MKVEMPYVLAMVKLDGADSLFTHQLRNWGTDRTKIKIRDAGQGCLHQGAGGAPDASHVV